MKDALSDQQQIIEAVESSRVPAHLISQAQRMKMDAFDGRRLQTAMNTTDFATVPWPSFPWLCMTGVRDCIKRHLWTRRCFGFSLAVPLWCAGDASRLEEQSLPMCWG